MTREEAKAEINKVFEPAFANYIITALTEGATPSDYKVGHWISDDPFHKKVMLECGQVSCSCHCSECEDWLMASDEYPCRGYYCPNCGAKMEVEE